MLPGFKEHTADLTDADMRLCRVAWVILNRVFQTGKSITNKEIDTYIASETGQRAGGPKIRKMINWMHTSGHLPGLIADSKGYRKAKSLKELEEYAASLKGRITAIQARLRAVKKDMDNHEQQQLTFK